jgi:hypothetical protein
LFLANYFLKLKLFIMVQSDQQVILQLDSLDVVSFI